MPGFDKRISGLWVRVKAAQTPAACGLEAYAENVTRSTGI